MAQYVIEESTLKGLADAIRSVNGESRTYTATEMIEAVTTIMESVTYILADENGKEVPAVFVESETIFTANANDIRLGKVAATASGVTEGTKEIPAYYVAEGYRLVTAGSLFAISVDEWDYTKLQVIICPFNTSLANSVAAEKVVIEDSVYNSGSTDAVSTVIKDTANERIDLGITNNTENRYLIRYFMYKEVY